MKKYPSFVSSFAGHTTKVARAQDTFHSFVDLRRQRSLSFATRTTSQRLRQLICPVFIASSTTTPLRRFRSIKSNSSTKAVRKRMYADLEPKIYKKRDFTEALEALGSLQSNSSTIESWLKERTENKETTLANEMRSYLRRVDVNLNSLSCIHVTGTKGKGSTCAFVESIMRRGYGLKTGLYTSPNLVHVRERIRINGKPVPEDVFLQHFWHCWDALQSTKTEEYPYMPAFFRFLTVLGFRIFENEKVDVAIIEVGIGGRTDATNVIVGEANGVATIGYDHCNVLGNTLTEIAFEKSGIFKEGKAAITSPQVEEAMKKLTERADERKASVFYVAPQLETFQGEPVVLGLDGDFQRSNAALAISLCKEYLAARLDTLSPSLKDQVSKDIAAISQNILPQAFREGLAQCRWPGRGQKVKMASSKAKDVTLYIDGAHTEESVDVCVKWFESYAALPAREGGATTTQKPVNVLIFNCNKTKDAQKMLNVLASSELGFHLIVFTTFETQNKMKVHKVERPPLPSSGNTTTATTTEAPTTGEKEKSGVVKNPLEWQESNAALWDRLRTTHKAEEEREKEAKAIVGSIPEAFEELESFVGKLHPDTPVHVLVTGSLYLVGGVLEVLIANGSLSEEALDL